MKKIILILILTLTIFLRFWRLGEIPEGFHADEAAFGYNAYSILLTGRDEYGHFLPLILRSFDDYKGAVYSYLTVPFVWLFDLSEGTVRAPSAIFGVLLVLVSYLLVNRLTKKRTLSLLTSVLISISPLSIFLSRVQSDPLVAAFFVILGFYFFLTWLDKSKTIYLVLSFFVWAASFFTYASPRVFLPIFILVVTTFYFKRLSFKQKLLFVIGAVLLFLLAGSLMFGTKGQRFNQLSVFNTPTVILPLEEKIREDGQAPVILTRVFHNKAVDYGNYLFRNYTQYLSFDFLFLKGGEPQREMVPNSGILYLVELPFLIFGLYRIFAKKIKWGYFIVSWFLIVPAVLSFASHESPNVHRFFLAILPIELIIALGILEFFQAIKVSKSFYLFFLLVIPLLFAQNLFFFWHQLFSHQPVHQPWHRGFAYKELVTSLNKYSPQFKKIVVTKGNASPYIYLLFYNKYDPQKYQAIGSPRDFDYKGFDNYYFVPLDCPLWGGKTGEDEVKGETGILYVNKGTCVDPLHNAKLLEIVRWGDNSPAFKLLEYISTVSAEIKR